MMKEEAHNPVSEQTFLLIKEYLHSAKDKQSQFLKKLQEDAEFMKNILDICFRPTSYQKQNNIVLTADIPALITDILSSLYEDFIQLIACDKIQKQENQLLGLESQSQIANEVDQENNDGKEEFIMLRQIHLGILQNEPEEAALSYFNKIIGRVFYHRPAEIMRFYEKQPAIMINIISKMNNKTIAELFCKLLEIQSGKQFFKQYKIKYLRRYYDNLTSILHSNGKCQAWLEGLLQMHKFLTDKMDQKIDQSKYNHILKEINILDFQILKNINNRIDSISDYQFLLCLKWIEELVKKDGYIMGQPNIKLCLTNMNRKNSISSNFYGDESPKQPTSFHLEQEQLVQISKTLQHSITRYTQSSSQEKKGQNILYIYRILYFLIRIWTNFARQQNPTHKQLISGIINQSFMNKTYDIALKHPFNNSLHNYIKQFIVEAIYSKLISPEYFYNAEQTYKKIILSNFPKKKFSQHESTFYNKICLIYKELINLYPLNHPLLQINNLIKDQQERNSRLIGGDPRKLQKDTFRGSSNGLSESSQSYEQFIQFDLCSNKSSGLSSSSRTPVVKRSSLTSFSEYADIVQGQQYTIKQKIQQQND